MTASRLALALALSAPLAFNAADGGHGRSVGRQGGGPGEFQGIHGLGLLAGDTIMAWDWNALRTSTFTPDGEFVRSVSPTLAEQGFAPQFFGAFSDGSFVIRPSITPSSLLGAAMGCAVTPRPTRATTAPAEHSSIPSPSHRARSGPSNRGERASRSRRSRSRIDLT
ncbi:MAG: hypothetical protein ACREM1_03190 [Longimicrobiales bacterium]